MMMRGRTDQGAVAVIFAISCVLLFSFAALAVDLGNAFVRKRDVQAQADFAALAGGSELPGIKSASDPAVLAVLDYLNANRPQDDSGIVAVEASHLVDGPAVDPNPALLDPVERNGEVYFLSATRLQVITPDAQINFGLAGAVGQNATIVNADATVGAFTPGSVMPVYTVSGCDYGNQSITDPATTPAPTVPPLAHDGDTNSATLSSVTPPEVSYQASGASVTLTGKDFKDITKVGFFRADDTDPALVVEQTVFTPAPGPSGYTKAGNASISFVVPDTVTAIENAWYLRVYEDGTTDKWSARTQAVPLRVGEAVLECSASSSDGNFGTLKLPRYTPTADSSWVPVNMSEGLEPPLGLTIHTSATADGLCTDGLNGAVVSRSAPALLKPGTNCVDTDTGLPAQVATAGFITGHSGYEGRLIASQSSTSDGGGCAPDGTTSVRSISAPPATYTINNDVLTCFLTNDDTSLYDITRPSYAASDPVLSADIYDSPRFFWQPVLKVDPSTGGSQTYSIVDFRPGFITDEVVASTTQRDTTMTATADNGLRIENGQIKQIRLIFFDPDALPKESNGPVWTPYLGVGPQAILFLD